MAEHTSGNPNVRRDSRNETNRIKKKRKKKRGFLSRLKNLKFSRNIGIDLGTATVLVYVQGQGIVLEEPSVVAIDTMTDRILKVGKEAQQMLGRTPGNITAVRPLRDGVISQYEVTLMMIQHLSAVPAEICFSVLTL
jgi:actin-like ATPase involved in cell morphogenesis